MTCDSVSKLIPLYFYGELTPDEEDRVEQHLHDCGKCASAMERQRALAVALDRRVAEVPPMLLEDCRADLMAAIQGGAPRAAERATKGPWTLFLEAIGASMHGFSRFRQPIGALALLTVGFLAARLTMTKPAITAAPTPAEDVFATVRSVTPDNSGHVQIAFDETRRRTVTGSMEDQNIQKLLLAAAHEENPAVRVESVGLLTSRAMTADIRDVLLNAVAHDANPGVRMKALEGLKTVAMDGEVRKTLAQVLLSDQNDAVRMQAVDLLVAHRDGSMIGVLQGAVQKEDNDYVRLKLQKALKDMNASIGTF